MAEQEVLIAGIRNQREILDNLITRLEEKRLLDSYDYQLGEETMKQVKRNLGRLRKFAMEAWVKDQLANQVKSASDYFFGN
ncbi:MAG: hypothetical protein COV74_07165 [Candidatus Omnitrophica bacterium CG11_big_fil_rev_8_21_14_0_20_45_26]|uniref:Uncharacterized protein n=1 Tax=Candidatus Abzuiibacterium crystallinum TaxID=1974748 RepID=A0A2H0LN47_9BACT|nr:MAG: hypothetical protein COV74_07165 [Candidatus Omnitrophica bacterium CG11_big_fil_rev_8_21_14_0_20_45_26]PIW65482.1 MAG: hypothetical protein COW12_01425 [Candidatus Omnitrophica bacterium CG12_big_fil_rev_8_21_14_0_65_45_16]